MTKRVVIIGPAHPLRGGLASFNQRLAVECMTAQSDTTIFSYSLQYPSFLFPGKTQFSDEPAPENINVQSVINSINPFNWIRIGNRLRKQKPDIIIVRFWLPFMGAALGTILRRVQKNKHSKIICIADNIIPHEKKPGDKFLTRYFIKSCDAFITMSEKVMSDLRKIEKTKPALFVAHPLYDNFGEVLNKETARRKIGIESEGPIILFFGFIRKYKGLDLLLQAMSILKNRSTQIKKPTLLIAGEFYADEKIYLNQIEQLAIKDLLILRTNFIPDSEVKYYLSAADLVVQPYKSATQSGVTPLAYHFEKPMLVTNVGGLPSLVPHLKVGLVVEPTPESIADGILQFYELGEEYFIPQLRSEKKKYSWNSFVHHIFNLAHDIQK